MKLQRLIGTVLAASSVFLFVTAASMLSELSKPEFLIPLVNSCRTGRLD